MFFQRIAFYLTKTRLSIYWRIVDNQNHVYLLKIMPLKSVGENDVDVHRQEPPDRFCGS